MKPRLLFMIATVLATLVFVFFSTEKAGADIASSSNNSLPMGKPEAMIDLTTQEGVRAIQGAWRYSDTKIVEVDFHAPGMDGQPTGAPVKTYDYTPHAGT